MQVLFSFFGGDGAIVLGGCLMEEILHCFIFGGVGLLPILSVNLLPIYLSFDFLVFVDVQVLNCAALIDALDLVQSEIWLFCRF